MVARSGGRTGRGEGEMNSTTNTRTEKHTNRKGEKIILEEEEGMYPERPDFIPTRVAEGPTLLPFSVLRWRPRCPPGPTWQWRQGGGGPHRPRFLSRVVPLAFRREKDASSPRSPRPARGQRSDWHVGPECASGPRVSVGFGHGRGGILRRGRCGAGEF